MPSYSIVFRLLLVLCTLLGVVSSHAAERVRIDLEDAALKALLTRHLDLPEVGGQEPESADFVLLRRARKEIRDILATEGYFSPAIERVARDGSRDGADGILHISVVPGRRTVVSQVELRFSGVLTEPAWAERLAAVRQAWSLSVGEPFRQGTWDEAKQRVADFLTARDFAAARISDSRAVIDPETASAKLEIDVDSGPAFRFGALEVSGLSDYDETLVRRYKPPTPGEPYSQERLLRFQTALQNTSYFASVVVDIDRATATPDAASIQVQVAEARPKKIGFGGGVSSNTGYRVETSYRDAHFMGQPWNLVSGIRLEQRRQLGYADVFLPPALEGYLDSFGVLAERTDIAGLRTQRQSVGVVRTIPSGNVENRFAINYQNEILTPDGGVHSTRSALAANWSWTYRAVDSILDPHKGHVLNLQLGGASRALLSDRNFVRLYGRYQLFVPVRERDVLILRAEGGVTVAASRDGVPQDFLFRTGGAQTVRGYAYQSLGVAEGSATVGGRYMAVTSAEYVHWYKDSNWGVATFVDAGNANDERKLFKMNLGYGVGPRWRSPAGPIAVDVAYGQRDHRLRLQFAVAIAF